MGIKAGGNLVEPWRKKQEMQGSEALHWRRGSILPSLGHRGPRVGHWGRITGAGMFPAGRAQESFA